MTAERDDDALLDMLIAAGGAVRLTRDVTQAEFSKDEALQLAVIHYIQIIGEAARKVSRERRATVSEIPWGQVIGMRHRVVHDYFDVRLPIVWDVVKNHLPPLIATLEIIVPPEEN